MTSFQTRTFRAGGADIAFVTFGIDESPLAPALERSLAECDRRIGLPNVVKQTFFLSRQIAPEEVERAVAGPYGYSRPATTCVRQPPLDSRLLACEIWAFPSDARVDQHERVTVASTSDTRWGFLGGAVTAPGEPLPEGVSRLLTQAREDLARVGLAFSDLVRTWYYVGDILETEANVLRYDQFNRTRNEFYADTWPDLCLTPASTGVGMQGDCLALEALAIQGRPPGFAPSWIDNPLQTKPYMYDGPTDADTKPSFSRAAAVKLDRSAILFVSGTASIRGSNVVYPEDPAAQTGATIENIAALLAPDNLAAQCGARRGAGLDDLLLVRVYLKRPQDLAPVRRRCRRLLPDVPHTYLLADICRPECLVEIEAVAAFND